MNPPRSSSGLSSLHAFFSQRAGDESPLDIFRMIEAGFPLGGVVQVLESLNILGNRRLLNLVLGMSASTLRRRAKGSEEKLDPIHSERLFRLATLATYAADVLGSKELATVWLCKPAAGLEGHVPVDLIANGAGYEVALSFLDRIKYGVYQ